ncbi:MAG TPA: PKD-like family lipoprotein [Pedobacter sp.]|uniref:PKD-like family lipoprotein n=1 Tax=Pedobacter sp. TaxID=1411316 RepID=UPI002CAAD0C8|nr:PKD-like family lipoprotein [Pedobacter sp.]HMI03883.1 PKD-like family lipoprotein [Pedobacter sp.]
MDIKKLMILMAVLVFSLAACHKDLGHYDINMPVEPEVTTLDSVYNAIVGDSLIIDPGVKGPPGAELEMSWKISERTGGDITYTGPKLRVIFGLAAQRYDGMLTVYNKTNGMKYFYKFKVNGATDFEKGTTVLSVENGVTQFSFIKADGTLQARLYKAMQGKDLPSDPLYLFFLRNKYTGGVMLGYWIITKHDGVRLEPNTMMEHDRYPNQLKDNFFTSPDDLEVGSLVAHEQGVMMGVVNGKFYGGTTSTWDQASTYGMFGLSAEGDYDLAPSFAMAVTDPGTYFICFDKNRKQFVRINYYGTPVYFGTQYSVEGGNIFDPMNVGMDLIKLVQLNNADCYAIMKSADGKIYELKFNVKFTGPFSFTAQQKREFIRPDLVTPTTKWQGAKNGVIYIASGTKVVRYNPVNQEVKDLVTNFGGKEITMLKLSEDEETLLVGTDGTIWFTNIKTGEGGSLIKKIEGIPGAPVDMAIRTN